jgi:uncharacterized sulfatase
MTNILFIILDTLRRDRLSLYGHTRPTSPFLDEFASRATVFDRAVAPAQWTIASHASMFTGLYPHQHGMTQANHALSQAFPTLAEILQVNGYHTAAFCNNPLVGLLDNGLQRGFERFYNYASPAPNRPTDPTLPQALETLRQAFSGVTRRTINRFAHNDTLFRLSLLPVFTQIWSHTVNYKGSTAFSTQDLGDYWHRHVTQSDKPLFAFLNLMGTHMPLRPPQATIERLNPTLKGNASYKWMAGYNGDGLRWISPLEEPLTDWQDEALTSFYDAEIAEQDALLGKMLATMEARGDLDDTLVIIGADHGEGLGDHLYCGHSFVVFHELTHVPWLIRYPERFAAGRTSNNVSTRRVFHTILDIAGIHKALPVDDPNSDITTLSLTNALTAEADSEQGIAYSEAYPPDTLLDILVRRQSPLLASRQLQQVRRSITRGDEKLAVVGNQIEGLYHLPSDPAEVHNLAPQQTERATHLLQQLQQFVGNASLATPTHQDISPVVLDNLRALGYVE